MSVTSKVCFYLLPSTTTAIIVDESSPLYALRASNVDNSEASSYSRMEKSKAHRIVARVDKVRVLILQLFVFLFATATSR